VTRNGFTLISKRIYPGDGPPFEGFVRISGGKILAVGNRDRVSQRTPDGQSPNAAQVLSRESCAGIGVAAAAHAAAESTACRIAPEAVPDAAPEAEIILDVGDNAVIPGLIDLHVHGSGGHSAARGATALEGMARFLALHGVTAFQPTLGAAPLAEMEDSVIAAGECIRAGRRDPGSSRGAEAIGLHLEGPFLSPLFSGAIPKEYLVAPEISLLEKWMELSGGSISQVTLAPELPGALDAIRYLVGRGTRVAMGHTGAVYEEAVQGFRAGVKIVTHAFNAMRGFHHREPGALGAALVQEGVFCELIADGIHVHPAAMSLLVTSCGVDSVVLVSDAMPAAGLPPGQYEFLGQRVALDAGGKVTLDDGTLAGSSAVLVRCLRNMIESAGVSFDEALRMATVNPAKAAGVFDGKGSLTPGKDADIVVLSDDYEVLGCWVRGRQVKNAFCEREVSAR
jgi:N-acetylglucosamine-6-phosphate deacetylase